MVVIQMGRIVDGQKPMPRCLNPALIGRIEMIAIKHYPGIRVDRQHLRGNLPIYGIGIGVTQEVEFKPRFPEPQEQPFIPTARHANYPGADIMPCLS